MSSSSESEKAGDGVPAPLPFPGPTACSILVAWANRQDHWVRRITREVLASRQELPEAVLTDVYRAYRVEKGLDSGDVQPVPPLDEIAEVSEAIDPLSLLTLDQLRGVNALAPDQTISFCPQLTLLFGENGSGKTGYVRVLKSAANVRTVEPVLGNVRGDDRAPRSVRLQYRLGDGPTASVTWQGETGVAPFTRMSVFDARAVTLHVDGELSFSYTPRDLALFRHVAAAVNRVKERLETDRSSRLRTANPYLARFDRATSFYAQIETLGPTTVVDDLRALAAVSAEEESGRAALRERVDLLRSQSLESQVQLARTQAALARTVEASAMAVLGFNAEAYAGEVAMLAEAEVAHRVSTDDAWAGSAIPGVLAPAWREMVEAAQRYASEVEHERYPGDGDVCLYCRQRLDVPAIELLTKYRTYITASTRRAVDGARDRLRSRQKMAPFSSIADLRRALTQSAAILDGDVSLANAAKAFVEAADEALKAIADGAAVNLEPARLAAETARSIASSAAVRADTVVADLSARADERARLLAAESLRLRELEARLLLRDLLPEIGGYVADAKSASRAASLLGRFGPLQHSLTDATKEASIGLVNADFERRFQEESLALKAPVVSLDFPGRKAEPARRKTVVPQYKLSEILSEGEQKVIALADFLAEATLRRTAAPIVFDDPVNSLDYRRSDYVAKRIVDLATQQQVVVFTHNIMLTVALLEDARERGIQVRYFDVKADDGRVGLISEGSSPRVDSPAAIEKRIKATIEAASKETGDLREMLIERGYSLLRSWCEVFVEVDLLKGVSRRFEPNIRLHSLPNIRTDRLDAAISVVGEVFSKACRVTEAHSQVLESLGVRPSLDELKADFQRLVDARAEHGKK